VLSTDYSVEELESQHASLLPEREALGLINLTNIIAVNLAIAVNAGTAGSLASAVANQWISVSQS
jgi:hypothetical protein